MVAKSIAPFGLRMPEELKEWLVRIAQENHRSANSEIVLRLERSRKVEETVSSRGEA